MHEMTVAARLVDLVVEVVTEQSAASAVLVKLRLGALTCINPDALRFGFEALSRETVAADCALEIEHVEAEARCRGCGWEGKVGDPLDLACPHCESRDLALSEGRELTLKSVTVQ